MQTLRREEKLKPQSTFVCCVLYYWAVCDLLHSYKTNKNVGNSQRNWNLCNHGDWYLLYNHLFWNQAAINTSCFRINYKGWMCCHTSSHWQSSGCLMPTEGKEGYLYQCVMSKWDQLLQTASTWHKLNFWVILWRIHLYAGIHFVFLK